MVVQELVDEYVASTKPDYISRGMIMTPNVSAAALLLVHVTSMGRGLQHMCNNSHKPGQLQGQS